MSRWVIWAFRALSVILLILVWEWQAAQPRAFAFASLGKVVSALVSGITSGEFFRAAGGTLGTMLIGYLLAIVIGIVLGCAVTFWRWGEWTLRPLIDALNIAPISMFLPLIALYLGTGEVGRVFVVFMWAVFTIYETTSAGISQTPPTLLEMSSAFGARPLQRWWTVILPAAFPSLAVGLRLALGRAFRGALTAELLLSTANLGSILTGANTLYNIPRLLAGVLFITTLGVLLLRGAEGLERRALRRFRG